MLLHRVSPPPAASSSSLSSCCVLPTRIAASLAGWRRRPAGNGGGAVALVRCSPRAEEVGAGAGAPADDVEARARVKAKLKVGSPIVVLEAPPMLKTAASVPSLRHNAGQVKAGDVGRIMARKPKDVWAVRLAAGMYLLDGKYFKPLDVDEDDGVESSPDKDT